MAYWQTGKETDELVPFCLFGMEALFCLTKCITMMHLRRHSTTLVDERLYTTIVFAMGRLR